jgi:hypothetical protein
LLRLQSSNVLVVQGEAKFGFEAFLHAPEAESDQKRLDDKKSDITTDQDCQ